MDCESMIYSEDYMDLILNSASIDLSLFDERGCMVNVTPRIINIYYQKSAIAPLSLEDYSYEEIPKCLTIMEEPENVQDSVFASIVNKQELTGEGIMIGFLDTGIRYESASFRNSDGSTRIVGIWDQTTRGKAPDGFYYGSAYTREEIDEALRSADPQQLVPVTDTNGHGTYIASIAAGSVGGPEGLEGIAPKAEIAVVKLKEAKEYLKEFYLIKNNGEQGQQPIFQENDVMLAMKYLKELAESRKKELVICMALGSGPSNYASLPYLSDYIEYLSEGHNHIIIGTGNEANKRHHFCGKLGDNMPLDIEVRSSNNRVGYWLEIWGNIPDFYTIGITSPGGDTVDKILYKLNQTQQFNFSFEKTKITVNYLLYGSKVLNPLVVIRVLTPSDGVWKFRLNAERIVYGEVNAYLPLTGFIDGESYFLESSPNRTLVNPSGTDDAITFGAYDPRRNSIYYASGRGYPPLGLIKPDLAAQGVQVLGLGPSENLTAFSGTGVAASVAAGTVALFLEWGVVQGNSPNMGNTMVHNFLLQGATRSDNREYPNREWGYGALDLEQTLSLFRYS